MDYTPPGLLDGLSHFIWTYVLIYVLLGAGIYFGIRTRFVQFRLFGRMVKQLRGSREGAEGGISGFQAFAIGLASRVGTGNITGVAIALTLGGPGAIFWMWVVALLGMATAFVEATLAQLYKVRSEDGSFRGGPAYYIQTGLGSRKGGVVFAVLLVLTFGIAFSMVQANTIADVLNNGHDVQVNVTAVILALMLQPILFGGLRRVARVAELVLPIMAAVYVGLAVIIIVLNIGSLPHVLGMIVGSAFGIGDAAAGVAGGVSAALLNGTKRGLFSNEAGMGSAPNSAATATTSHPANQGLIQSLGVFVDSILICSATAFIILMAGEAVYDPGTTSEAAGASLTQSAVEYVLGGWAGWIMTVLVFVFAFSSVLGNYAYCEVNMSFLGFGRQALNVFRVIVIASVMVGSVVALQSVWTLADVAMGLMALVNLVAILLLGKWAFGALRDYERSSRAGETPRFAASDNPDMPGQLQTDVW